MNPRMRVASLGILGYLVLSTDLALAQTSFPYPLTYPSNNLALERQQQESACYNFAKQQTGIDPSQLSSNSGGQLQTYYSAWSSCMQGQNVNNNNMEVTQNPYPEPFAYPANNQQPVQVQQDHYTCYNSAKQQTGVDPSQLSPSTLAQSSQQGSIIQSALKGSLVGGVGNANNGGNIEGGEIGSGIGALDGLQQPGTSQQPTQANLNEQQQLQTYYNAWTPCMQGRGYTPMTLTQNRFSEAFAYPANQQTPEQQQQDHYACYMWAEQQTGVNPSQLSTNTVTQSSQQGSTIGGVLQGALMGVVGHAIDGGNSGTEADIGAGIGALEGLFQPKGSQQQANQVQAQANTTEQQQLQAYYRAWTACMQGRGYIVN